MSTTTELLNNEKPANEIVKKEENPVAIADSFSSMTNFENTWRMAGCLSKSSLIPPNFIGKPQDCMIAIDMSRRMGANPFMILQNIYIVHGKPAWSSQFLIACINSCGKFSPLRYKQVGEKGKPSYGYLAHAIDVKYNENLEGPEVTMEMAEKEGWTKKNGSKWLTMPDLMLRYRAATFFARLFAPELTMGMKTEEEIYDVEVEDVAPVEEKKESKFDSAVKEKKPAKAKKSDLELLQEHIDKNGVPVSAEEIKAFVEGQGEMFSFEMIKPNINKIAEMILAGVEK